MGNLPGDPALTGARASDPPTGIKHASARWHLLSFLLGPLVVLGGLWLLWVVVVAGAGSLFWGAAAGLIDQEISPAVARAELFYRLDRSFGVRLHADWQVLRARDMRAKFRGDGHKWFLVRLPVGRMKDFEADLIAADRLVSREPGRPLLVEKPRRGDEADDWSKFVPAGSRTWQARDQYHDLIMVSGDQFYYDLKVP